jgi:hypothetical protein
MISAAVSLENSALAHGSTPVSSFPYAPVILLTFKRIISLVYQMNSHDIMAELLIKVCEMNVSILFDGPMESDYDETEEGDRSRGAAKIPFAPLLWKESLVDLTKETFRSKFLSLFPELREVYFPALSHTAPVVESAASYQYSMPDLLQLIHHPISEVREGVILGCLDSLTEITELEDAGLSSKSEKLPSKSTLILSFLTLASNTKVLQNQSFLTVLFRRITTEVEPPILQITLQLISMSVVSSS